MSLPAGNPVVTGTTISSTVHNNTNSDIANEITNSVPRDGTAPPTANLPMGGFKHTNVANATARTEYCSAGQAQDNTFDWLTSVAGTDTITASLTPAISAYTAGQTFRLVSAGANTTTAVTININSLGAKSITKNGSTALAIGDIVNGEMLEIIYDGTRFQLIKLYINNAPFIDSTPLLKGSADATKLVAFEVDGLTTATTRTVTVPDKNGTMAMLSDIPAAVNTGRVQQIQTAVTSTVATGTTVIPADNTIPQNTEGDQYMTITITPSNASSTLEIDVAFLCSHSVGSAAVIAAIFQDATANALATAYVNIGAATTATELVIKHIMTAGTTSATTFKVRAGGSTAGTLTFNGTSGAAFFGGTLSSRITVREYLP